MPSPNFSHLRGLSVASSARAEFVFYAIQGEPKLTVKPSTEANRPYLNAVLQGSRRFAKRLRGGKVTPEVMADTRDQDRRLFPLHVVEGWDQDSVLDSEDQPVPFSVEACASFLEALPNDMFDELRAFCATPDNFRTDEGDEDDSAEVAKN